MKSLPDASFGSLLIVYVGIPNLKKATNSSSSCEALSAFVHSLHRDYVVWYAKSVRRVYRAYWALQLTVLLSGFLSSVMAAIVTPGTFTTWGKWVLIVAPAIGSLAAACLLQFRVHELWRLREQGRISFQDLAVTGKRRLAEAGSDEECGRIYKELQGSTREIEQEQSDSFFGLYRAGFVARYDAEIRTSAK